MDALAHFIEKQLARSVKPEIRLIADEARARHRNVRAVLAYGSCLRGVSTSDSLIDLYVLTADAAGVSPNRLSRLACRLVPPNVYYIESELAGRRYRAKYAVLTEADFLGWMKASNPYFWARFAQPAACIHRAPDSAVAVAIAEALRTMYAHALGLSSSRDPLDIWADGFMATYRTELRPETPERGRALVDANREYYVEAARLLAGTAPVRTSWAFRRLSGKTLTVLRLVKAAFTFAGGADYLAWKIERHSGEKVALTAWQKRHPILAGFLLLPQLLRRGAIR